ncbi:cell division protein FtsA [Aminipila luticellarii]|uniref:Cell division protein FtsA n=1 Tax=Aminipila luticellarii TaxID=2507160 RepID=A0A410PSY0_9FIRM|nr:cell division protein FtsA [Aminipila luticellarii]QAT42024.1 cell division protein FtsA [Aminipila luticellarii]
MDDRKIVFALDIGTRSVVGIVGALKDGCFNVLDYEQEFHEKRAMRDGQIEDIDLVAQVATQVKTKLEQRCGQTFTKVSIAAAGRALRTAAASFSFDLIPSEPITKKIVQYMEYSAIEKAQEAFLSETAHQDAGIKDYYCVGYSVTEYSLDNYKIKNLEGQKGTKASVDIIAAFLPASVLVSLYAVTARCGLEVDNLTLEPIAAIHAVVPDDVRFLNIALVDIGGGTSDIAISRDGSITAYDMVTIAGDEITEALMQHYLTNFATAEQIKLMLSGEETISFKDILGNQAEVTPDEAFEAVKEPIDSLAEAISQRILLINGSAPAAVFLVGGGSQIRDLCKIVAKKLGMPENRVAIGVVNTDNNLSLFSENLYSPTFVTPIGIGIVSSLYRGCDFFAITVNGKRIMLFNHQVIKVIDALMFSGIKPAGLIGLTPPSLVYTINGVRRTRKGSPGVPGELLVNGSPATVETEIRQGDEITVTLAQNGQPPSLTLLEALDLEGFDLAHIVFLTVNEVKIDAYDVNALKMRPIGYMDQIMVALSERAVNETAFLGIKSVKESPSLETKPTKESPSLELARDSVEINKIYSRDLNKSSVSLLLAEDEPTASPVPTDSQPKSKLTFAAEEIETEPEATTNPDSMKSTDRVESSEPAEQAEKASESKTASSFLTFEGNEPLNGMELTVTLNGSPVHLVQETEEPLILMHLLKYADLDVSKPRGELVLKLNGIDANYADSLHDHDVAVIKWSEEL